MADISQDARFYFMAKEQESRNFNEGLKKDREIYARRKLNTAEHKSFSRHENKELKSYHKQAKSLSAKSKALRA